MANPSKQRGTAAESAVVAWLVANGWPAAERRALSGNKDKGDVAGIPGVVIEVKSCKTMDLAGWVKELEAEMVNAEVSIGAVIAKKRGTTNPAEWYAVMPAWVLVEILQQVERAEATAELYRRWEEA